MKNDDNTLTIGLDLCDKTHDYDSIDAGGEEIATGKVGNKPDALIRWLKAYPGAKIIMETGTHSSCLERSGREKTRRKPLSITPPPLHSPL